MYSGLCVKIPEEFNVITSPFLLNENYDKKVFSTLAMCVEKIVNDYHNDVLESCMVYNPIDWYINNCLFEEDRMFYNQYRNVLYEKIYFYNNTLYILSDLVVTTCNCSVHDEVTIFNNYKIPSHDFQRILDSFINTEPYGKEKYKRILITIVNNQDNKKSTYIINFDEIKSHIPNCIVCGNHNWKYYYTSSTPPHNLTCDECGYTFNDMSRFMYTIKRKDAILKERKGENK